MIGTKREGAFKFADRLSVAPQSVQEIAKVVPSRGGCRIQCDRRAVCSLCLCGSTDGVERDAQAPILSGGLAVALKQSNHLRKSFRFVGNIGAAAKSTWVVRATKRRLQSRVGVLCFAAFASHDRFGNI